MKKKLLSLTTAVLLSALLMFAGCGGKDPAGSGAGGAAAPGGTNLMAMLPANALGVFSINFRKFAESKLFEQMMKEQEGKEDDGELFKNYQDFVDKTGMDPKKDIYSMSIAVFGEMGRKEPEVVALLNADYKKDVIMNLMKAQKVPFTEEDYSGITICNVKDPKGEEMSFSFMKDNVLAFGKISLIKKVIDLSQGKGQSINQDANLKGHLGSIKSDAIVSFVFNIPDEIKKVRNAGMFQMDMTKAEALLGYFDHSGSAWEGEIKLLSNNEEANQNMVSALNSFKMMAGAGGPEYVELAEKINLSASANDVKLSISLPDALIEKIQNKIKEQTGQAVQGNE